MSVFQSVALGFVKGFVVGVAVVVGLLIAALWFVVVTVFWIASKGT